MCVHSSYLSSEREHICKAVKTLDLLLLVLLLLFPVYQYVGMLVNVHLYFGTTLTIPQSPHPQPPSSVTEPLPNSGPAVQSQRGCPDKEPGESVSMETALRGKSVIGSGGVGGEDGRESVVMEVLQLYSAQQQRLQSTLHRQKQLEKVCVE